MATFIAIAVLVLCGAIALIAGYSLVARSWGGRPRLLAVSSYPWWIDVSFMLIFVIPFVSAVEALFMGEPFWLFHLIARATGNAA